jgi:tetratricopeptide (TPR) repeat protein
MSMQKSYSNRNDYFWTFCLTLKIENINKGKKDKSMKNSMLKKGCLFLWIMAIPFLSVYASQDSSLFLRANEAYRSNDFGSAIQYYTEIANQGNEGAILFYNLGNSYYKSGEQAKAILWYERALRLDPQNDDIQHNLLFVNQKLIDKIDRIPELFISKLWDNLSRSMTSHTWAILSIIFSFLFFSLIIFLILSKRQWVRITSFFFTVIIAIMLIFSIVFADKELKRSIKVPEAIIMESVVTTKNTPTASGSDLFVIHEGLKVSITDRVGEWYEIKIPNGEKGWVEQSCLEII